MAVVDRLCLEHLLEEDTVHPVFTGGDTDRRDGFADGSVSEDVVGARRLLDPQRLELGELLDPVDGLRHVPHLVGVDHEVGVPTDDLARDTEAPDVVLEVRADLELDVAVALRRPLP